MRALVLDAGGVHVADRPEPEGGAGLAIVRVSLAGICRTDLELIDGYMGFRGVLGHEFVGSVVDGPAALMGRRVVGEINFACRRCETCLGGLARHCPNRRVMGILGADGAFAEMVAVPPVNLHVVPDGVSDEAAVFTEPLAAAFEILEQVPVRTGLDTVVLGDGKLGQLVAQVLAQAGARILAVGRHVAKLDLLARRGIATVELSDWDRSPADLVVEATGTPQGLALALAATRPRGTVVLKSTIAAQHGVDLAPLVINEITVVGSRCGTFAPALHALETRSVEVEPLISARRSLDDAVDALSLAATPGILKVLLAV